MNDEWLTGDYRKDNDKKYLGHWDLDDLHDTVATIAGVKKEEVKNAHGSETKQVLYFKEKDLKPLILNKKVNPQAITKALGTPKRELWIGRKIFLYVGVEPKAEDGFAVRVRDYAPKENTYYCAECGAVIEDTTVDGKTYKGRVIAENAKSKYGKYLCYECAMKAKSDMEVK